MVYLTMLAVCRKVELSVNDHLEMMWKKAVVTEFEELSRHLPGGTQKNHVNTSHNSQGPG
jgi:hypothetical protein